MISSLHAIYNSMMLIQSKGIHSLQPCIGLPGKLSDETLQRQKITAENLTLLNPFPTEVTLEWRIEEYQVKCTAVMCPFGQQRKAITIRSTI
jgi:hypothetical protein